MAIDQKQIFSLLEQSCGSYFGEGINHRGQPFYATLTLHKSFTSKGIAFDFVAKGLGGEIYHKEHSILALTPEETVSLWVLSTNHPSLMEHRYEAQDTPLEETKKFVFSFGKMNNLNEFRETISFQFFSDDSITYTYSWGLPGEPFAERSSVRMQPGSSMPIPEAKLVPTEHGLVPEGKGWYIINAKEARWSTNEKFGDHLGFEGNEKFEQLGINIHVLYPNQPNCHYHGEDDQEDFLVLQGECKLLIEGEERILKPWDFVHCPKWARHVFVGQGNAPCLLVMAGSRSGIGVIYPNIPLALKYGAAPENSTNSPKESYANSPKSKFSTSKLPN